MDESQEVSGKPRCVSCQKEYESHTLLGHTSWCFKCASLRLSAFFRKNRTATAANAAATLSLGVVIPEPVDGD